MQNQIGNLFHDKFRLLNSQEHNDDIKWTSSSSDYETTNETSCYFDKKKNRKRKRKKKVLKQVSNLNITITDVNKNCKSEPSIDKSPILKSKRVTSRISPILFTNSEERKENSPILCKKIYQPKSPIVQMKSVLNSNRVKKKLSYASHNKSETSNICQYDIKNNVKCLTKDDVDNISLKSEISSNNTSDVSLKIKLAEWIKNFFDSNFSSETTSQNISDTPTPTDNSINEDDDILSCKTQSVSALQPIKCESNSNSDTSSFNESTKKIKYKKGGLAYRLNALLKKQNAHVCLWQHERFLASNSNFVIPKEEFMAFHIQNVEYKYGCYFLSVLDLDLNKYFIVINKKYFSVNLKVESVFKLYEPYTILPLNQDYKVVINVCKFECIDLKEK